MKYFSMPFRFIAAYAGYFWNRLVMGKPDMTFEEVNERLNLCSTCPNRIDHQCAMCGCTLMRKAQLPNVDCPIHVWSRAIEISQAFENGDITVDEYEDKIQKLYEGD